MKWIFDSLISYLNHYLFQTSSTCVHTPLDLSVTWYRSRYFLTFYVLKFEVLEIAAKKARDKKNHEIILTLQNSVKIAGKKAKDEKNHEIILTLQNFVKIYELQRSSFKKHEHTYPCLPLFIAVSLKLEFQFYKWIKNKIGKNTLNAKKKKKLLI